MVYMPSDTLTDYSATIRVQIENDVRRLKWILEGKRQADQEDYVNAQYVELGYLVNSHHGERLFNEGDLICGIPVSLDGTNGRTIRVCTDNVRFVEEIEFLDEDNEVDIRRRVYYEDLYKETTW